MGAESKVQMIVLVSSSLGSVLGRLEEELRVFPYVYNADSSYPTCNMVRLSWAGAGFDVR